MNIDDPLLVPSKEGPKSPHIGYRIPGKRSGGGAKRAIYCSNWFLLAAQK
ncbi:polymorphic toxin type 47 domain-containing protein [Pseudomonas synxantha]